MYTTDGIDIIAFDELYQQSKFIVESATTPA